MTARACPHCRQPLEPEEAAAFCPICGQDLAAAPGADSRDSAPTRAAAADPAPASGIAAAAGADPTPEPPAAEAGAGGAPAGRRAGILEAAAARAEALAERGAASADRPALDREPDADSAVWTDGMERSQCDDWDIQFNCSRVFVQNMMFPFEFRLRPLREGLSNLRVEIRLDQALLNSDEPELEISRGQPIPIYFNYAPPSGLGGKISYDVLVGFTRDGGDHWFRAMVKHHVFKAQETIGHVIHTLNIELKNDIKQGHAGDAQVHQAINGLEALKSRASDPVRELAEFDIPPRWKTLPLKKCHHYRPPREGGGFLPHPVQRPPPAAQARGLTLRCGTLTARLLAAPLLQLGRHKDSDILARPLSRREEDVLWISQFHCCLRLDGNRCLLLDRRLPAPARQAKPSTHGTFLDGRRVGDADGAPIVAGRRHLLTLGSADPDDSACVAFDLDLQACGQADPCQPACRGRAAPDSPACLILRQRGRPHEAIVALWKHAALGLLDARLGSACVCRQQDAFLLHLGGRCDWLTPGQTLRAPHGEVRVEPFRHPDV